MATKLTATMQHQALQGRQNLAPKKIGSHKFLFYCSLPQRNLSNMRNRSFVVMKGPFVTSYSSTSGKLEAGR